MAGMRCGLTANSQKLNQVLGKSLIFKRFTKNPEPKFIAKPVVLAQGSAFFLDHETF